jgi:2-polyprenyl-3-methyl-5-hydroxy-6-metoxy-1,4-benzoquinol methylase
MSAGGEKRAFDQYAENYENALASGLRISGEGREYFARVRIELLIKRLAELKIAPSKVLDFGCGDGSSTGHLLQIPGVWNVLGIDVSAESIKRAQELFASENVSFRTMEGAPKGGRYDMVFCNGVFHHVALEKRSAAVSFLFGALKPGGLIALWENNPWNPGTKLIMSRIPFDKEALTLTAPGTRRMLRTGGFEVLLTDFAFYFPRWLAPLRVFDAALRKVPFGGQYMVLARKPDREVGSENKK